MSLSAREEPHLEPLMEGQVPGPAPGSSGHRHSARSLPHSTTVPSTMAWLCRALVTSFPHFTEAGKLQAQPLNCPQSPQVVGALEPRLAGTYKATLVPRGS